MKPATKKNIAFIGRSMMWSVLLYATIMVAANWDDVSSAVKGNNIVTIMNNGQQEGIVTAMQPATVAQHSHAVSGALVVLKGLAEVMVVLSH